MKSEDCVEKILFSWSGGKDSSLALHEILKSGKYKVAALMTTVTQDYDRISMHGVRSELLSKQAEALNLSLEKMFISKNSSNMDYEEIMGRLLNQYQSNGVNTVAFGDIFLDDLRRYREENLAKVQMNALFPLWKKDSVNLAEYFIDCGFRAILTCVDTDCLDKGFCGREYDLSLLSDLPENVDPCGENGEFHTFVYAGPIFDREILIAKGDIILKDERFCFCDLLPV